MIGLKIQWLRKKDEIWCDMKEKWEKKKKKKKRMGPCRHTETLFSTHLVLLERFRRNDFNYTLKEQQKMS
jgi:hypothetical protein